MNTKRVTTIGFGRYKVNSRYGFGKLVTRHDELRFPMADLKRVRAALQSFAARVDRHYTIAAAGAQIVVKLAWDTAPETEETPLIVETDETDNDGDEEDII